MKKIIALALVAMMAVCLFAGCGSSSNKLTMATNAEFPPFEYLDGEKIVGADVEIAEAIAETLGKELELTNIDFDAALTGAAAGKHDRAVAGTSATDETSTFSTTNTKSSHSRQVLRLLQL